MDKIINNESLITSDPQNANIKDLIFTIRGVQVMLDSDVAMLYGYETKAINLAAKRNIDRFPPEFRFQLTVGELRDCSRFQNETLNGDEEADEILKSQFATSNSTSNLRFQSETSSLNNDAQMEKRGGRRYLPYVYTEQGIGMLSGILKNDTAIQVSIGIMNAFVEMRKIITANRFVFEQISNINNKLIQHDNELSSQSIKINEILNLLNRPETNKQWIFYKGQFYDAFTLVIELIEKATTSIIVIDNYADNSVLDMLANKKAGATVIIITANPGKLSIQHINKFTAQYGKVNVVASKEFHDRFIILDEKEIYAFGASLKDLGNKCFEVSKIEDETRFLSYVQGII